MRTAASLVLAAGLVASLVACTGPTETTVACDATPPGAASDAVKVSGDFGSKPQVTIASPTDAAKTQRTVVIVGDGEPALPGDNVKVEFTLFNGTSGEELTATEYGQTPTTTFPVDDTQFLPGIVLTMECSTVGSRVVGVIPPDDSFAGAGSAELGVGPDDDLVFVVDIVSIDPPVEPPLPKADGAEQPTTDGFPAVVLAEDGTPTVTIPATGPPSELKIALLKTGAGSEVQPGDDVVVHYVGVNWNTGVIFDSSWDRGEPATFNTNAVIAGFTAALVGQAVGSQVIVIIPPDQGYGAAGSPPNIGGTDTLVFVVDILGIA